MNRNFARIIPALAVALFLSAFGVSALAQAAAAPAQQNLKIGVIDMQAAILGSNEGQRDFQALQKKFEPKKAEIDGLNKELDDLKKQYSAQGDKLNQDARENLLKQIDTKQKQLNRTLEDAQGDAQAQQQDIVNRIGQKMYQVLEKFAKDNSYSLILDVAGQQNPVLWAAETTNITPAVVKAYNEQSGVAAPAKPAAPAGGAVQKPAGAATKPPAKP